MKRVLKGIRTEWLNLAISIRRNSCELSDSVFILGSPRSGTTWLMEIVTGISGRSPIYEPLRPGSDRFEALIGRLDGFLVLDRSSVQPDLADYLVRVATGRRVSHWSLSQSTLQRHLHSKGYVVKFVRVSRAAAWLSATIPVKQIRIVRGPVATIESYLNSPGPWHTWDVGQFSTLVFGDKTRMLDLLGTTTPTSVQWFAAWWAAETSALLEPALDVAVVCYEDLVRRDAATIDTIVAQCGAPAAHDVESVLARPSATSNDRRSAGTKGAFSTRRLLSASETRDVEAIARDFGLDAW